MSDITIHLNIHVDSVDEVAVQHHTPPKNANPFTAVTFGTGDARATLYLRDPDTAQKIASACMCVVRRWTSLDGGQVS